MDSLAILPLKTPPKTHPRGLAEHLPAPPFVLMAVGGCGSGKTVAVFNMLVRRVFYRNHFDRIELISPTAAGDTSMEKLLGSRAVSHHPLLSDELVQELLREQDELVEEARDEGDDPPEVLWVIDDCLGSNSLGPHSALARLVATHRHHHVSLLITSQIYKGAAPVVRANLSGLLVWDLVNEAERRKLEEEWGGTFPDILALLTQATRGKKYSFLYLRMPRAGALEARERFDGPVLWSKDSQDERLSIRKAGRRAP